MLGNYGHVVSFILEEDDKLIPNKKIYHISGKVFDDVGNYQKFIDTLKKVNYMDISTFLDYHYLNFPAPKVFFFEIAKILNDQKNNLIKKSIENIQKWLDKEEDWYLKSKSNQLLFSDLTDPKNTLLNLFYNNKSLYNKFFNVLEKHGIIENSEQTNKKIWLYKKSVINPIKACFDALINQQIILNTSNMKELRLIVDAEIAHPGEGNDEVFKRKN